ncbi:MAG: CotH kinase family protein, partial [Cyclobacteriaceae bacterium]|nr:CotH kinase family protein [Cyclobacteriaceae bacterium]
MNKYFLIVLLFCASGAIAQPINPADDVVYKSDEVATIYLTLTPEAKAFFLNPANKFSEQYFPAQFRFVNAVTDQTLTYQVGVRLRGNTSRDHEKKSYKIDFREYGGASFYTYKKFNLKPDVNDPSLMREPMTYQIYRAMNVLAPRTHYTRLFMNGEYMGLYINVESIDDEFMDLRFGREDGFLYKASFGADLANTSQATNTSLFESQMNDNLPDNRSALANFINVLNNTPTDLLKTELEKIFEVDRFLRQYAVEALLGHWDAYAYNKNNYYLYYNGQSGKFDFIPYDTDNTWGIDWVNRDWATRDLNNWQRTNEARPLVTRILAVEEYRLTYQHYLRILLNEYFNTTYLTPRFNAIKTMIGPAIENDTYYPRAFGFDINDFANSLNDGISGTQVDYGLLEYIQVRRTKALEQIPALVTSVEDPQSVTNENLPYPNPSSNPYFVLNVNLEQTAALEVIDSNGKPQRFKL